MKKLVALVMAIALLVGCTAFTATAEEMPTITMIYTGDNNPPEDNEVITELRNRTGVNIKITYTTSADYDAKLQTMLASDTYPDIIVGLKNQDLLDMVAAGKVIDVEPLLAEYGQNILANVDIEDVRKMPANANGLYGWPAYNSRYHKVLTVRNDWLEAVGMEVPTTLEEYYDVMYAFTYNDPDGNGVNDTWGMSMSTASQNFYTGILAAYDIPFYGASSAVLLEDGTVTTVMKHPKFLEAMTYLNKLYTDGLIDPDFVNLTNMQAFEQFWNSKTGVLGWECVGPTNNWYPGRYTWDVADDPADEFSFIYLNDKSAWKIYPDYNKSEWCISAKCANPEAALKVIDYMWYSEEGQELIYMGIEGTHFEWVDKANGKYQRLGIYTDDTTHRAAGAFVYGFGKTEVNAETRIMNAKTQAGLIEAAEKAVDYPYIASVLETRTEYGADLDALVTECIANMIVAKDGLDTMLADYIQRWEDEGGLEYEEEATAAYAAQ